VGSEFRSALTANGIGSRIIVSPVGAEEPLASATQNVTKLTADEAQARRRALESTIGSLLIEGMELEPGEREILERHARGEIDLPTMRAQMDAYIEAHP